MPVSRRRALGLAGGAAALYLVPGKTSTSLLGPCLFALGGAGAAGVSRSVTILRRELQIAMALTGRRSFAEIDSSVLWGA